MPEYTIEMLWTCHVCKQEKNRGLQRHCRNCGHPKGDKDEEFFPEDLTKALSGEDEARAEAGPDWKCRYCDSLQSSLNKCCTECGVDPVTGSKSWEAKEKEITENVETGEKTETTGAPTTASIDRLERFSEKTDHLDDMPPGGRMRAVAPRILGAFAVLFAFVFLGWLLFRTRIVDARVASVRWEHRVLVDRYQVFHRDGFDPEPGAFHVASQGQRFHHTDHVRVGSHTEHYNARVSCGQSCVDQPCYTSKRSCYTSKRNCRSNKNGTATCTGGDLICTGGDRICPSPKCTTKYCDEPRTRTVDDYEDQPRTREYYAWDTWDWAPNRTVRRAGVGLETNWPSDEDLRAPLAEGEQERTRRKEEYHVAFAGKGETYDYAPKDEGEFRRFQPGTRWRLKVGVARGVEVMPP